MVFAQSFALLLLLLIVWWLWVMACAAQIAVADMQAGHTEEQRRGVSIFPGFPLFPLIAFALAIFIDGYFHPYGTLAIGSLHIIFGFALATSIVRNRSLLKKMSVS